MRKLVLIMVLCIFLLGCKQDKLKLPPRPDGDIDEENVTIDEQSVNIHGVNIQGKAGTYCLITNQSGSRIRIQIFTTYFDNRRTDFVTLVNTNKMRILLQDVDLLIKNCGTDETLGFLHADKKTFWYEEYEQK